MINYINSLISDISYVDFNFNESSNSWFNESLEGDLIKRDITKAEYDFFNQNFKVIDQTSFGNGFSATTFQVTTNNVPGYSKGDIFVGYRGTEDTTLGIFTDGLYTDLGNVSLGTSSIVDVFSKAIEVMTGSDFSVTQATSARQYLANISQLPEAQGRLITVTGHSLGGYLATYATLTNSSVVKETATFNAPAMFLLDGLIANVFNMIALENSNVTLDGVTTEERSEISKKIFHFYSNVSIELTASSNPLNSYIGTRIPLYAEDISGISNHFVKYTREAMFVYESLRLILKIPVEQAYSQITTFLENFKYPDIEKNYLSSSSEKIQLNMFKSTNALATMLGLSNGVSVLTSLSNNSNKYSFIDANSNFSITTSNTYNNRLKLYSVLNYVPFIIQSNTSSSYITDIKYNPSLYRQEFLDSRIDFYKKIIVAADKDLTQNNYNNSDGSNTLLYTFFESTVGEKMAYIDYTNKLVLLQNMTREEFFTDLSIKKVYYIDSVSTGSITITGNNSIVFDSLGNDNFHINGSDVNLYLSHGKENIIINVDKGGSLGIVESMDNAAGDIFYFLGDKINDNNITGTKYTDNITGGSGNDILFGGDGKDVIYGELGDDVINGGNGIDTIYGGDGNDIINNVDMTDSSYLSVGGGDIVTGGKGDDIIYGTKLNNRYNYTLGDGNDTIIERVKGVEVDSSGNYIVDSIYFTDISADEVIFYHNGTANLYMTLPDGAVITFTNFMQLMLVEKFIFGSTTLVYTDILNKVLERTVINSDTPLIGNDNIDITLVETLRGQSNIVNRIEGGYGKDKIFGGNLNDILGNQSKSSSSYLSIINSNQVGSYGDDFTGGKGDDIIFGTIFADNYYYNKGDGNDTIIEQSLNNQNSNSNYIDKIILGQGITRANTTIIRDFDNNVILKFTFADSNSNGQILMKDFIKGLGVEQIVFGDSTIMTSSQILSEALIFYGTDHDETIFGTDKNDTIYGLGGNDIIYGYGGVNKLYGGDGNDVIAMNSSPIAYTNSNELLSYIDGGAGNDIIGDASAFNGFSNARVDITGGLGDDIIYGSAYANIYRFNIGDGNDTILTSINGTYGYDTLIFGESILKSDVVFERLNVKDLNVKYTSNDSVLILNYFSTGSSLKIFKFNNTDVVDFTKVNNQIINTYGTDGNDIFNTIHYAEILKAGAGDDKITNYSIGQQRTFSGEYYGESGNDTLDLMGRDMIISGGSGTNIINISSTNFSNSKNTILFSSSDNAYDYVKTDSYTPYVFKFDTRLEDLSVSYMKMSNSDILTVELKYSDNSYLNLERHWSYYLENKYSFEFLDHTVNFSSLGQNVILSNNQNNYFYGSVFSSVFVNGGNSKDDILGSRGNDVIYGNAGDDHIKGDEGNDIIYGGLGNDTLEGGAGNDSLYGGEGDDYMISGTGTFDYMEGGIGDDKYIWNSTTALISDSSGNDRVYLHNGGSKLDYHFEKIGFNLVITRKNSPETSLTISDHYGAGAIETFSIGYRYGTYNLVGDRINNLVNLMAEFDATSDEDIKNEINNRIQNSWVG